MPRNQVRRATTHLLDSFCSLAKCLYELRVGGKSQIIVAGKVDLGFATYVNGGRHAMTNGYQSTIQVFLALFIKG
jgi:GT2 family glycosyltransferase